MARRSTRSPTGHTILAVDDQQDSLVSVRNLLEREGHRVLIAESGEQALAVVKTTEVDLMIVDYLMPRMNGAQLVRAVRSFDPFVQLILQTGYSGERPPRVMLAELDIQGYHDKADDPERLLLWVDVALKSYRMVHAIGLEGDIHPEEKPLGIVRLVVVALDVELGEHHARRTLAGIAGLQDE